MKNINPKTPRILILGAKGMLGRSVFNYFKSQFPNNTWGTDKTHFNSYRHENDFKKLISKIKKIDYVVNCIGIVDDNKPLKELIYVNSLFPNILERYAQKYKFYLIHISSDAVFPKLAGKVNEKSKPIPESTYGISKFLGETAGLRAITIRTSILGFDPNNHRGLLEEVKRAKKNIKGYVNQTWSGCTVLQFAKLCEWIIKKNKFSRIRKFSNIIHFSPLQTTKFDILKNYLRLLPKKYVLKKVNSTKITRYLYSDYFDLNILKMYNINIKSSLAELIKFENENTLKT